MSMRWLHQEMMFRYKVRMFRARIGDGFQVHLVTALSHQTDKWIFTACGYRTRYTPNVHATKVKVTCKKCLKAIS